MVRIWLRTRSEGVHRVERWQPSVQQGDAGTGQGEEPSSLSKCWDYLVDHTKELEVRLHLHLIITTKDVGILLGCMYGCIRDESLKDEILPIIIAKFSIPTLFSCAPSHHQTLLSNLTTLLKFCFPKAEAENREVLQNEYNELGNILSKVDMPSYETFVNIYSKILVNSFSLRSDRLVSYIHIRAIASFAASLNIMFTFYK